MKLLASAVLFCAGSVLATSAMSTNLAGGGATLPAGAYVGFDFINKPTMGDSAKLSQGVTPPSYGANVLSNSLFGAWSATTGNKISYCQTGSGAGKRFLNGDSTGTLTATGSCGPNSGTPSLAGFNIDATNFPSSQNPDFIASDAPLSQGEYTTFITNKAAHVEPTQFPALVGSIAVIYNIPGLTARLDLTESQVCQVFSGKAATWGAVTPALKDVNGNTVTLPNPNLAIKIAFRSDGSGTTFNFSNHLAGNCGSGDVVGGHFDTDQTWSAASPATSVIKDLIGFPTSSSSLLPSNGNPAVVSAVAANAGAVGYAEEANVLANPSSSLQTAKITGKDPVTDLVTTFNAPSGSLVSDQAITGVSATNGTPTLSALTSVPGQTGCVLIVNPNSYSKGVVAGAGYPIVAVTYLLANSRGNSTNVTALRSFLLNPYGSHTGVTTVGAGTGYAFIGNAGVNTLKVNGCVQ